MKILVIGKYDQDSFASHISQTFSAMGHSLINYEIGIKYKSYQNSLLRNYESTKRVLYDIFNNFEAGKKWEIKKIITSCQTSIDLIISTSDFFYPEQVTELKKYYKCPMVMWYPDHIINLKKSLFLTSDYDFVFFKEPFFVDVLRREFNCKNIYYLPECFNPLVHKISDNKPSLTDKYISDITTAGNLHPYRVKFFSELQNYDIKIWGNPAPGWIDMKLIKKYFQNHYIADEEKAYVFHHSKIVINNLYPGEIWGINVRAFEIAGCGGFQLINWRPGLNQLFVDEKELVSFKNFNELIEKIDYYLNNQNERRLIADAGQRRAYKDHTYNLRLQLLLKTIFENEKGFEIPEVILS